MQAIILAAGTGSRLKNLTASVPKALVRIGDKPLLSYNIAFAQLVGCNDILVVVGAFAEKTKAYLDGLFLPGLRWVENKEYQKGNLYSLGAALRLVETDFLLLNVDHLYRSAIAGLVRKQCYDLMAFCDRDRTLSTDDMKVKTDDQGRLFRISKQLTDFDAGYVGMTYCSEKYLDSYCKAFDRVAERSGDQAVVEMILDDLARSGSPPLVGDIGGVGWLEVDTPDELTGAKRTVMNTPEDFAALEY